jgi:hypothetical protein
MCFIFATGSGSVLTDGFELSSFKLGDITWDYSSGYVASAGLGGMYSTAGDHVGVATGFIGIADGNVIAGLAGRVTVSQ